MKRCEMLHAIVHSNVLKIFVSLSNIGQLYRGLSNENYLGVVLTFNKKQKSKNGESTHSVVVVYDQENQVSLPSKFYFLLFFLPEGREDNTRESFQ